jgi:hypothetical protein
MEAHVAVQVGRGGVSKVDAPRSVLPLAEVPPMLTLARVRRALEEQAAVETAYLYRAEGTSGTPELTVGVVVSDGAMAERVASEMAGTLKGVSEAATIVAFAQESAALDAVRNGAALYMVTVPLEKDLSNSFMVALLAGFLGLGVVSTIANLFGMSRKPDDVFARRFTEPGRLRLR